jgi:hypothetical protein
MPAAVHHSVTNTCPLCDGKNVVRDAWSEWCETSQEWVLQNVFDDAFCLDCEVFVTLNEEPLVTEEPGTGT